MRTHRQHLLDDFKKFIKDKKFENILELGSNDKSDFKDKCDCNYVMTDKNDGVLMEDLPFGDNTFDLVFSCHAFEHCENPLQALKEMKRVSKKWVLIFTPYHCKHHVLDSDSDHIFVLTEMQMRRLMGYVGFKSNIYVSVPRNPEQFWNLVSIGEK